MADNVGTGRPDDHSGHPQRGRGQSDHDLRGASSSLGFGGYVYKSATDRHIVAASSTHTPYSLMDALYGVGNFTRVNDLYDQLWRHSAGGSSSIVLESRYAGFQNQLGVDPFPQSSIGKLTQEFTRLATVSGSAMNAQFTNINTTYAHILSGSQIEIFRTDTTITTQRGQQIIKTSYKGLGDPFTWLIKTPESTPKIWSSLLGQNVDHMDHSVTFRVNRNGQTRYVVAFEDLRNGGSDYDYNDVVFEVSSIPSVPEPTSLMIAGLGGAGDGRFTVLAPAIALTESLWAKGPPPGRILHFRPEPVRPDFGAQERTV